jgi:large subunit ribosomal protein L5
MSTTTAVEAGKIQPRLKQKYNNEIKKQLQDEFGYGNVMQIPGLV